jgi:hypothetical protein
MNPLEHLTTTLAACPRAGLDGLSAAIAGSPNFAPGLLACLEHAVDCEINRRAGVHFQLQGPRAAIDVSEVRYSLAALKMLAAHFKASPAQEGAALAPFLEAAAALLAADAEPPDVLQ